MDEREEFYEKIVRKRLQSKVSSILVCGGGSLDKNVFERLGLGDSAVDVAAVRCHVCAVRSSIDSAGEAAASAVVADALFGALCIDEYRKLTGRDTFAGNDN